MGEEEFVSITKEYVRKTAYRTALQNIETGIIPELDQGNYNDAILWYRQLDPQAQKHVRRFIRGGVHSTMFEFMCLLEGNQVFLECNEPENQNEEALEGWFMVCTVDGETLEPTLVSETSGPLAKFHEIYNCVGDPFLSTDIASSKELE